MVILARISYAFFWLILMVLIGLATYRAVMNQPDLMPEDRQVVKPNDQIGNIIARTPRLEEVGPDGKIRWRLESEGMTGDIQGAFHMTRAQAVINLEDGSSITLTSPEGDYDRPSRKLTLTGGVNAVNDKNELSFWAKEIEWNGQEKTLKSLGEDIKMSRGNWDFHASGITVIIVGEETQIELMEPVKVEGYR